MRSFALAMIGLILLGTASVSRASAAWYVPLPASQGQSAAQLESLERLLNLDGTLNLTNGFSGSLDAHGWTMHIDGGGQPRFTRAAQASPTSVLDDAAWDTRFGRPGVDGPIYTIAISGTNIYVGGAFHAAGNVNASNIARWDGHTWSALGQGVGGGGSDTKPPSVAAIAISGTDVYVGGLFAMADGQSTSNIARWDGRSWHALGSGATNGVDGPVNAILISGPYVYVGGAFSSAGSAAAGNIARWDGSSWSPLGGSGNGVNGPVDALAASGNTLYVGGDFYSAGGQAATAIARWDGQAWVGLGGLRGPTSFSSPVVAAIVISGNAIYVGGTFCINNFSICHIARWDGSAWHALGIGVEGQLPSVTVVRSLAIAGNDLYVGGNFRSAGGTSVSNIARWDGSTWHALGADGSGVNGTVNAIAHSGTDMFVGIGVNPFSSSPPTSDYILRWAGGDWRLLGSDLTNGVDGTVATIAISGTEVYVGGRFTRVGTLPAHNIARWDGHSWHTLGSGDHEGTSDTVYALAFVGQYLYVGGIFFKAGGVDISYLARWDGASWSAVGSPGSNGLDGAVTALAVEGAHLYVGGDFQHIGGLVAGGVARWDGGAWHALGAGAASGVDGSVTSLAIIGNSVYVGGHFFVAGNTSARNIARWDGSIWHPLGGEVDNGVDGGVLALAANGTDLYVGGHFTVAGAVSANNIARWDGSAWHPLNSGAANGTNGEVAALVVSRTDLYVGGLFTAAGETSANNIARWDGTWRALGSGVTGEQNGAQLVWAMAASGSNLYVGGSFNRAGDRPAFGFSRWQTAPLKHVFLSMVSS